MLPANCLNPGNDEHVADPATSWELALFSDPSSDEAVVATNNEDGAPGSIEAERNLAMVRVFVSLA